MGVTESGNWVANYQTAPLAANTNLEIFNDAHVIQARIKTFGGQNLGTTALSEIVEKDHAVTLYSSSSNLGIVAYNISNPGLPVEIQKYDLRVGSETTQPGSIRTIKESEGSVWVVENKRLHVFDKLTGVRSSLFVLDNNIVSMSETATQFIVIQDNGNAQIIKKPSANGGRVELGALVPLGGNGPSVTVGNDVYVALGTTIRTYSFSGDTVHKGQVMTVSKSVSAMYAYKGFIYTLHSDGLSVFDTQTGEQKGSYSWTAGSVVGISFNDNKLYLAEKSSGVQVVHAGPTGNPLEVVINTDDARQEAITISTTVISSGARSDISQKLVVNDKPSVDVSGVFGPTQTLTGRVGSTLSLTISKGDVEDLNIETLTLSLKTNDNRLVFNVAQTAGGWQLTALPSADNRNPISEGVQPATLTVTDEYGMSQEYPVFIDIPNPGPGFSSGFSWPNTKTVTVGDASNNIIDFNGRITGVGVTAAVTQSPSFNGNPLITINANNQVVITAPRDAYGTHECEVTFTDDRNVKKVQKFTVVVNANPLSVLGQTIDIGEPEVGDSISKIIPDYVTSPDGFKIQKSVSLIDKVTGEAVSFLQASSGAGGTLLSGTIPNEINGVSTVGKTYKLQVTSTAVTESGQVITNLDPVVYETEFTIPDRPNVVSFISARPVINVGNDSTPIVIQVSDPDRSPILPTADISLAGAHNTTIRVQDNGNGQYSVYLKPGIEDAGNIVTLTAKSGAVEKTFDCQVLYTPPSFTTEIPQAIEIEFGAPARSIPMPLSSHFEQGLLGLSTSSEQRIPSEIKVNNVAQSVDIEGGLTATKLGVGVNGEYALPVTIKPYGSEGGIVRSVQRADMTVRVVSGIGARFNETLQVPQGESVSLRNGFVLSASTLKQSTQTTVTVSVDNDNQQGRLLDATGAHLSLTYTGTMAEIQTQLDALQLSSLGTNDKPIRLKITINNGIDPVIEKTKVVAVNGKPDYLVPTDKLLEKRTVKSEDNTEVSINVYDYVKSIDTSDPTPITAVNVHSTGPAASSVTFDPITGQLSIVFPPTDNDFSYSLAFQTNQPGLDPARQPTLTGQVGVVLNAKENDSFLLFDTWVHGIQSILKLWGLSGAAAGVATIPTRLNANRKIKQTNKPIKAKIKEMTITSTESVDEIYDRLTQKLSRLKRAVSGELFAEAESIGEQRSNLELTSLSVMKLGFRLIREKLINKEVKFKQKDTLDDVEITLLEILNNCLDHLGRVAEKKNFGDPQNVEYASVVTRLTFLLMALSKSKTTTKITQQHRSDLLSKVGAMDAHFSAHAYRPKNAEIVGDLLRETSASYEIINAMRDTSEWKQQIGRAFLSIAVPVIGALDTWKFLTKHPGSGKDLEAITHLMMESIHGQYDSQSSARVRETMRRLRISEEGRFSSVSMLLRYLTVAAKREGVVANRAPLSSVAENIKLGSLRFRRLELCGNLGKKIVREQKERLRHIISGDFTDEQVQMNNAMSLDGVTIVWTGENSTLERKKIGCFARRTKYKPPVQVVEAWVDPSTVVAHSDDEEAGTRRAAELSQFRTSSGVLRQPGGDSSQRSRVQRAGRARTGGAKLGEDATGLELTTSVSNPLQVLHRVQQHPQ